MCIDPVTIGLITAAQTAISSIASYTQQQQEYQTQLAAYDQSERAYAQQIQLNADAANRGYVSEQQKLQGEFMKASQEAQGRLTKSLQAQGAVLASGRSGKSIGLLMADAEREYGRDFANLAQNLTFARQDYFTGTESIFQQQKSANLTAASNRMLQPTSPGTGGLILGLGSAALSGISAGLGAKAPSSGGRGKASSLVKGRDIPISQLPPDMASP